MPTIRNKQLASRGKSRPRRHLSIVAAINLFFTQAYISSKCAGEDAVIAEYEVQPNGDLVTVPLRIDGKDYPFAIGTDSVYWFFDESLKAFLKPIDSRVEAAANGMKLFAVPAISFGPFSVGGAPRALCVRLRESIAVGGTDAYGAVGFASLADKVLRIDFDGRQMKANEAKRQMKGK